MKRRNRLILALLILGTMAMGVTLTIQSRENARRESYLNAQLDGSTADLDYILPYKNAYMGNASNSINLFYHLPLSGNPMTFEIFPDTLTLEVNINARVTEAGKNNLKDTPIALEGLKEVIDSYFTNTVYKALIYNSTAAFSLIGNLENVVYRFTDAEFRVNRADVEKLYKDFNKLLEESEWKEQVQKPLEDEAYIAEASNAILK